MDCRLATKAASMACAALLCAGAALASAEAPFASGKDGLHPRIERALPSWDAVGAAPANALYAGLWESAGGAEPGSAIAFAPRGDSIVATWFTYDTDGSPMWLALHAQDASTLIDGFAPQTTFVGELQRAFAPPAAAELTLVAYGPAVVEFAAPDIATLHYNVDGTWRSKTIVRSYAANTAGGCSPSPPFDGLWTSASSAIADFGGGLHVARAGDRVVAAWFTFDVQGNAVWRIMAAEHTDANAYAGTLYETRGSALASPFDARSVSVSEVGRATLAFGDGRGVLSYVVRGEPSAMSITRDTLATTLSRCD